MNKILIFLLVTFSMSFANSSADQEALKASMKSMGEQFKIIGMSLQQKEVTDVEYKASEQMQRDVADSSLIYPELATTDQLKLKNAMWMAELMKMSLALEEAMEVAMKQSPQDLSGVITIFREMNELRKKSHFEFKPEEE